MPASEACVHVRCGSFVGVGTVRPTGAGGSTRSMRIDADSDGVETFPATSTARTVYA